VVLSARLKRNVHEAGVLRFLFCVGVSQRVTGYSFKPIKKNPFC